MNDSNPDFTTRRVRAKKRSKKRVVDGSPRGKRRWMVMKILGGIVLFMLLWFISALGALRTFLPNTFDIIGWPGTERTYLVLFQNNAELRPTGGFITSVAVVHFQNGMLSDLEFQDVYGELDNHDYYPPPYPLDILLEEGSETYPGHSLRDANHSPDVTESIEEVLEFFAITHPEVEVDGVFLVNFALLEEVLGLYEPIEVQGIEFTENNLFETLETAVSDIDLHNIEALGSRKNILKDFANLMIREMVFSPWKWRQLTDVITENLNEKDVILYFEDEGLMDKASELGWDGKFYADTDERDSTDRLIVDISNWGGMKSDRYISREINYTIDITDELDEEGNPIIYSNLEVTLIHHGDYNIPLSGRYKGYLRVFLPMGAELIESSSEASAQEFITDHVGWGDLIELYPDESVTYTYRFQLNSQFLQDDEYRLKVIKQPGSSGDYYEVVVKTPQGTHMESSQLDTRENMAIFKDNLDRDESFEVTIYPDEKGPRIYGQQTVALDVIEVYFAEDLDVEVASDPDRYQIIDLDVNVPDVSTTIEVVDVEVVDGVLRIFTEGMGIQPEEHFQVIMDGVTDTNGNLVSPNPRTITVVQRLEDSESEFDAATDEF